MSRHRARAFFFHDRPKSSAPSSGPPSNGMRRMPDLNARTHWIRTRKLMLLTLALWLLFSIVLHLSVRPLNRIIVPYLDLPLGSFMSTHGVFIVVAVDAVLASYEPEQT